MLRELVVQGVYSLHLHDAVALQVAAEVATLYFISLRVQARAGLLIRF